MKRTMLATMAAVLVLTMSGCGGGDDKDNASGSGQSKQREAQLEFAQCMRDNGIENYPDPKVSESGNVQMVLDSSSGIDPDSAKFKTAQSKCQPALDKVMSDGGGPSSRTPQEQQEMKDQAVAYAQCMRDNGVDMPDPTFDDQGRVMMKMGGGSGSAEINKEKMTKAQEACRSKQPGGASNNMSGGASDGPSAVIGGGN